MKRILMLLAAGLPLLTLLGGCATTVGPKVITNSHVEYNEAVQKVVSEEILLNIVRRRYFEAPQFLTIASITTQISNSVGVAADGSGQFPDEGSDVYGVGVSGNASFSDTPTISIVPRADEEVTRKLTQRIFYDTPALLANVGYPFDLVFALTVESAGNVYGPQFGLENIFRPGTPEYVELVRRFRSLIEKNQLVVGSVMINDPYSAIAYEPEEITIDNQMTAVALGTGMGRFRSFDGGKTYYLCDQNYYTSLWIDEEARESEDGRRVLELLNLNPDPLYRFWKIENKKVPRDGPDFNTEQGDPPREYVSLLPRSFYSVLNFLAFMVQVPPEEIEEGIAFSTREYEQAVKDGLAVDLTQYLTIHWSETRPASAFVAIRHRGKWFYIDDRDPDSKRFFNAIFDLYNIEIAPAASGGGPLLTLPVN